MTTRTCIWEVRERRRRAGPHRQGRDHRHGRPRRGLTSVTPATVNAAAREATPHPTKHDAGHRDRVADPENRQRAIVQAVAAAPGVPHDGHLRPPEIRRSGSEPERHAGRGTPAGRRGPAGGRQAGAGRSTPGGKSGLSERPHRRVPEMPPPRPSCLATGRHPLQRAPDLRELLRVVGHGPQACPCALELVRLPHQTARSPCSAGGTLPEVDVSIKTGRSDGAPACPDLRRARVLEPARGRRGREPDDGGQQWPERTSSSERGGTCAPPSG